MTAADLEAYLRSEVAAGSFPSWQALVAQGEQILWEGAAGHAILEPIVVEATTSTLYDLASLTKPLVTALITLRLAEDGVLALEMPVGRVLQEMSEPPRDRVTVLDLLTHRGGFPAWEALYLRARPPLARFARAAAATPLAYPPGSRVLYSDLGFLVLGSFLEAVTGESLGALAHKLVLHALEKDQYGFPPDVDARARCAATERGNDYERRLAGASPGDPRFRTRIEPGEVHDGNAHALAGVSPHAGLFGTARAVFKLALAYLQPGGLLGPAAVSLARTNLTPESESHRSAAFELASTEGTAASGALPPDAVGHTGFTGTSLWMEPARARVYVLLTNRVHPAVRELNMNGIRRRFHALAAGV